MMFVREIAQLAQDFGLGVFEPTGSQDASDRTIFVGEIPQTVLDGDGNEVEITEAIWLVESPSPPPHSYVDTEYTIIDFWAMSPYTDRSHAKLEAVFTEFNRRHHYETANWYIYFSKALGSIIDVDRDQNNSKLYRLSVQFICRNVNNVS